MVWPYLIESCGFSSSAIFWNVLFASSWFATPSTIWGSESSTSIDAGSGLLPSSCSMMPGVVVDASKFSRAWSFVVNETFATPSRPRT